MLFRLRSRMRKVVRRPMLGSSCPLKRLLASRNSFNTRKPVISTGTCPVSSLWLKSRVLKDTRRPRIGPGIDPASLLLFKHRRTSPVSSPSSGMSFSLPLSGGTHFASAILCTRSPITRKPSQPTRLCLGFFFLFVLVRTTLAAAAAPPPPPSPSSSLSQSFSPSSPSFISFAKFTRRCSSFSFASFAKRSAFDTLSNNFAAFRLEACSW
mmetsp:Transcript_4741/g.8102  ORF Transcript_4741/g.8102 Transcript_4741/m.8102 type:complete len:210 (-) Transcript_4741:129-758(-)